MFIFFSLWCKKIISEKSYLSKTNCLNNLVLIFYTFFWQSPIMKNCECNMSVKISFFKFAILTYI